MLHHMDTPEKDAALADLRRAAKKLTEAEAKRDQLISDANQLGASMREIATAAGVHHTTIIRMLKPSAA
jgi:IS30 family transposase